LLLGGYYSEMLKREESEHEIGDARKKGDLSIHNTNLREKEHER